MNGYVSHIHVQVPEWLGELVKARMERLRLIGLEGQPLGRAMGHVVVIWAQVIAARLPHADERLDAPRLHAAFDALESHCTRWPAPAEIWQHMPARPEQRMLPPPPMSQEDRARALRMLAELREVTRMPE